MTQHPYPTDTTLDSPHSRPGVTVTFSKHNDAHHAVLERTLDRQRNSLNPSGSPMTFSELEKLFSTYLSDMVYAAIKEAFANNKDLIESGVLIDE